MQGFRSNVPRMKRMHEHPDNAPQGVQLLGQRANEHAGRLGYFRTVLLTFYEAFVPLQQQMWQYTHHSLSIRRNPSRRPHRQSILLMPH